MHVAILAVQLTFVISVSLSLLLSFTLLHLIRLVSLLLCSPIVAPLLATVAYHLCYTTTLTASDPLLLIATSVQSLVNGLSEVYTAHWVFHQWLFPVVSFAFVPLWTILWVLSWQKLSEQPKEHLE